MCLVVCASGTKGPFRSLHRFKMLEAIIKTELAIGTHTQPTCSARLEACLTIHTSIPALVASTAASHLLFFVHCADAKTGVLLSDDPDGVKTPPPEEHNPKKTMNLMATLAKGMKYVLTWQGAKFGVLSTPTQSAIMQILGI
jgi:hypothetical protein